MLAAAEASGDKKQQEHGPKPAEASQSTHEPSIHTLTCDPWTVES